MFIVDDPMLALISRFVMDSEQLDASNEEFLRQQVQSIEQYVDQFGADERQRRALEWIEEHAKHHRQSWQRRKVSEQLTERRCKDCPLIQDDAQPHCEIHAAWADLLRDYVDDKISSGQYVEDALKLLSDHKSQLKVAHSARPKR
jgi:hypothetical protein